MSVREHTVANPGPPPILDLRNPAGSVTVTAVEGSDRVDVRVEALDTAAEHSLADVEISAGPADGGTPLQVRVAVPERWLSRTPRFAVTVTEFVHPVVTQLDRGDVGSRHVVAHFNAAR